MSRTFFLVGLALCVPLATSVVGAADLDVQPQLDRAIIGPQLSLTEAQAFCERRLVPIPNFATSDEWQKYANEVRKRALDQVVFRGAAAAWRTAATKVEWLETSAGGEGYQIKKVRYEALPGMWVPALLYEPAKLSGKVPVFLNVNGHDAAGKAAPYKQTLCINQAKRGILSLNIEWFGMGQLKTEGFVHTRMNQLDLCGTSGVAPHFLAMSRGLDLLLSHPHADPKRVGVAGLSGGGWQTIFIGALDTRVTLTNPVAGYSSFATRIRNFTDLGDSEQTPVDLGMNADYSLLTAMLAPRAALLTFNAADNCCFAAGHALPPLLDAARPVYRLFGQENQLRSHVNQVPGDHNFGQDNREALYRAMGDTFFPGDAQYARQEIPCENELKKAEELRVELPEHNADFHSLALKLAESLPQKSIVPPTFEARSAWEIDALARLQKVTRAPEYEAVAAVDHRETMAGVEVVHWRLRLGDAWTVPTVEFGPKNALSTVLLIADGGRQSLAAEVQRLLAAQRRVIVADLFYDGESKLPHHNWLWALMLSTVGERPLGVQSAQLAAIARWVQLAGKGPVTVRAVGPKMSLVALTAACFEPDAIERVTTVGGLTTLKQVLTDNLTMNAHPEYFCFGLLEQIDIPQLIALAGAKKIEVLGK